MARATAKEEAEMTETKGGGRRGSDGEEEGREIEAWNNGGRSERAGQVRGRRRKVEPP